jgi:restriction endonuclease S subunit
MSTPTKTIGELAEVIAGFSPRPEERRKTGKYLLLGGRNIRNGDLVTTSADSYVNDIAKGSFQRAIARPGDLIVSTLFDRRKLLVYAADDPLAVVNSSCAIIRSAHAGDYIVSYLRTVQGQEDFLAKASKATGGTFIPRLSIADLAAIQIPILPVSELARLGDAKIERSTKPELISLKRELQSKDAEIGELKARNAALARFYEDRIRAIESQIATNDLLSRIKHGETARLEFKSSLRWNVHRKAHGPEIETEILKTIAAFCNTKGGELLIGVAPDNTVVGVEHDGFPDNDKFLLHLRNLLTERLKPCLVEFVEYGMVNLDGRWICHVQCKASNKDVWLKTDKNAPAQFFVRHGPSSTQLDGPDAVEYIREHFDQKRSPTTPPTVQ